MQSRGRCGGRPPDFVAAAVAACAAVFAGCAAPSRLEVPWAPPSRHELTAARAWLDSLRAELGPRTEEIRITLEAPLLPGAIRARGAIAVSPHRAARVVLLGPGGTTAADLWMDEDRHRLSIPVRDEVVRGRRGEALRGMPVELFRSWFLEPLEGELLDASIDGDVLRAVFRTSDATVFVRAVRLGELRIERHPRRGASSEPPDIEVVHAPRGTACATVTYERPRIGVHAEITCASRKPGVAERAMIDPDEATR